MNSAMNSAVGNDKDESDKTEDKATLETVIQVTRWTENLLSFRTTKPKDYTYQPGEYSRLGLQIGEYMTWRAFSLVSAPHEDFLEYYGVVVPGGLFTTQIQDIAPGFRVWIDKKSFGFMTPGRFVDGEHLWMLATGTGLGPFVSILRDPEVWTRFKHLLLVHGVRHNHEFAYQDELRAMRDAAALDPSRTQLTLIQASTREPHRESEHAPAGGILRGRITTLFESGALEQYAGLPITVESSRIMLCGNPDMIEEMRALLHKRGMRPCRRTLPGQFVTENYW